MRPAGAFLRAAGLALCLGLAAGPPARAGGEAEQDPAAAAKLRACAEQAAGRIQQHYDAVDDLEARFEQATRSVAFAGGAGGEQRAAGTVLFAKPGRMRWAYSEPEPSLVVSDGETLWLYDEAAREVQVLPVSGGFLSGAALQFLFGQGRIDESFRVEALACEPGSARLRLEPRSPSTYEALELRVDPASGQVQATSVADLFGNRTEVVFQEIRENRAPDPKLFRFDPPEGVRVMELAPASP